MRDCEEDKQHQMSTTLMGCEFFHVCVVLHFDSLFDLNRKDPETLGFRMDDDAKVMSVQPRSITDRPCMPHDNKIRKEEIKVEKK